MPSVIKQKTNDGTLKTVAIIPGLSDVIPNDLSGEAKIGLSKDAARADHSHKLPYNEPSEDDYNKFLKGDGTWSDVPYVLTQRERTLLLEILKNVSYINDQTDNINALGWGDENI